MSTRQGRQSENHGIEDNPGADNAESAAGRTPDPVVNCRIRVTLDQLKPYDNNPRTSRNPKFEEILISIENVGLTQPPSITRRSRDDSHYMIIDGGNTRLEILNILYRKYMHLANEAKSEGERQAHTGKAETFYAIDCIFKPWECESKALTGHLSENENRGEMLFIEKALAVQKLRKIYEEEDRNAARQQGLGYDGKPLSIRELAARITADGWTVSHSHITRYEYAANTLLKGISEAFWAGAGGPLVRSLRKYDSAYTRFWQESMTGQADPAQIESQFTEALRENDGEIFDTKGFLKNLNTRLSKLLDMDPNTIAVEVDAILKGSFDLPASLSGDGKKSLQRPGETLGKGENKSKAYPCAPPQASLPASVYETEGQEPNPSRSISSDNLPPKTRSNPRLTSGDRHSTGTQPPQATKLSESVIRRPQANLNPNQLLPAILKRVKAMAARYDFKIDELTRGQREGGYTNPFFIRPAEREFVPFEDDEAATVWWALTKYSGSAHIDRESRYRNHARILRTQYRRYLEERKWGLIGTLHYLEGCIIGQGLNPSVCEELFEIQCLCGRYLQQCTVIIE